MHIPILDARHLPPVRTRPACMADACNQGRDSCPCPEACEIPEPPMTAHDARMLLVLCCAAWGLPAALALLWWLA